MATRNTNKSKNNVAPKAKVEVKEVNNVDDTPIVEKPTENIVETKEPKKFNQNDGVLCRSITQGSLFCDGKSGITYEFVDYGDETEIQYGDLSAAVKAKAKYIFAPSILVLDEDFINEFPQLKRFYDEVYTVGDLKKVLDMPIDEMVNTIKNLPHTVYESLKTIAATQVYNGELDSVKKIRALDEVLGVDLSLLNELFANE